MPEARRRTSWWRAAVFIGGVPLALIAAWPTYEDLSESKEALASTAGVCATFAGFIIAILTILGDASALLPGNWRVAAVQAAEIGQRSLRLKFIFFCYLLTSFASIYMISIGSESSSWSDWVGYAYTSLVFYSLFVATELPQTLKSIHDDRIAAAIEQRQLEERAKRIIPPDEADALIQP